MSGNGVRLRIPNNADVTALLRAWGGGDEAALHQLVPLVEAELRRLARACLRGERVNHSLQATALVNEAFLRLVNVRDIEWQNRVHFFSMSARLMRRVLVDMARARRTDKRGGDAVMVSLDEVLIQDRAYDIDFIDLDEALRALAAFDERKGRVVELRFFGGLSVDETAEALGVSGKTVARDWEFAKAWLQREMRGSARHDD
jgi:RNA polymerase sigma factor (TIGR02999 family)